MKSTQNKIVRIGTKIANRVVSYIPTQKSLLDERPQAYQGPNRNYQKFIVLTHARSGSSMLVATLGQHPEIIRFQEIFTSGSIGFNTEGFDNNSEKMIRLRNRCPIEFLQRQIFSSYPSSIKAVGFKLFPEQIDNKHLSSVWDWIVANKSIRIILLTRDNLLEAYVSKLIALKTNGFRCMYESDRTNTTVNVNFEDCLSEFQKRHVYNQKALEQLKHHKLLCLEYEEVVRDLDNSFRKLQEFLGVTVQPISVVSLKKEVRPMSEVIENYAELRERFSDTQWKHLFNE